MLSYKHNAFFRYSHYIKVTCVISIGYLNSTVQYFGGETLMFKGGFRGGGGGRGSVPPLFQSGSPLFLKK